MADKRESYQDLLAEHGARAPYLVQALLERPAQPSKERLQAALTRRVGKLVPLDPRSELLAFALLDHRVDVQGNPIPVQHVVTLAPRLAAPKQLETSLAQTWDWPEARSALAASTATLVLSDLMAGALDRKLRMELFHGLVRSVLEELPVKALHWLPAQRLVNPKAYLEALDADRPLAASLVNVRLFKVDGPIPGEMVMDTLGLASFSLPDLQIHFAGLDPVKVAARLHSFAQRLFDHGDDFADGSDVAGITPKDRWTVKHTPSVAEPTRKTLTLDPGEAHRPRVAFPN